MQSDYIKNLRYKLQKRVRRLNSSSWNIFHDILKQFWNFLLSQPILFEIIQKLSAEIPESIDKKVQNALSGQVRFPLTLSTEKENAIVSYLVIKHCVESDSDYSEIEIGQQCSTNGRSQDSAVEAFRDIFIEPLYEYIDENLDDSGFILALIRKYKHKCEWFQRDKLYSIWNGDTSRGEKLLALDLYEYLYDQGIEFYIEPTSASGEVDVVASQTSKEPLIADAKIFNPDKSKGKDYIIKGFRQIYTYTLDYNEPIGYLVIFKTCENEIKFTFANQSQSISFARYNSKTIFFVVIDIFQYGKSASKRGQLKSYELTESELWESIDTQ